MTTRAQVLNNLFVQNLDSWQGKEKLSAAGGTFIRDRLREEMFTSHILTQEPVTRADCQVSTAHDTLVKLIWVEPESRAMTLTFRGEPTARFIRADRCEVPFMTIASEKFEKTEQELQVYDFAITKVIEDNSVKDMGEIVDREFLIHCESAVQAIQAEDNSVVTAPILDATTINGGAPPIESSVRKGELARQPGTTDNAYVWPLQRPDIVAICKMLDGRRLRSKTLLFTEYDFDDLNAWTLEDFGDKLESETAVEGFKYSTLIGKTFVRTIKTDILRPGNIYCFAAEEFLGKFFVLNATKFYIDKIANLVTWMSWMDVALAIVNVKSVVKLELYAGDASVNDNDSILSTVSPVQEDHLGAVNNRVSSGLVFPQVKIY
jgi:hypothetical protein